MKINAVGTIGTIGEMVIDTLKNNLCGCSLVFYEILDEDEKVIERVASINYKVIKKYKDTTCVFNIMTLKIIDVKESYTPNREFELTLDNSGDIIDTIKLDVSIDENLIVDSMDILIHSTQ